MKHSKITRRIDELGRIVIPKEIRENLNIKNGENIEISVDDPYILLTKYSKLEFNYQNIAKIIEIISRCFNLDIMVYDREKMICKYPLNCDFAVDITVPKEIIINSNLLGYLYIKSNDSVLCKQISNLIVSLLVI